MQVSWATREGVCTLSEVLERVWEKLMQHEKNCHEGVDLYSSLYECAHTCTLDVCLCVYPGTSAHDAETKDHHYISFLNILHLIFFFFWGRISPWSWSSFIWLDWLASELPGYFLRLLPPKPEWQMFACLAQILQGCWGEILILTVLSQSYYLLLGAKLLTTSYNIWSLVM